MFRIFHKETLGEKIVAQAKEQFPGFLVKTGFGLVGGAVLAGSRFGFQKMVEAATAEKKAVTCQQSPQTQQPQ